MLALIGMVNDRDTVLMHIGVYCVVVTFSLYLLLILPLVAIIQAIHQNAYFGVDTKWVSSSPGRVA
ncbi:hypothetical protein [Agromyces larvae]|uniref:Uncharacterized protein n=1 Tax=Agromyces larvae TaxID=2929802 RepID=A0ABY4BYV3_9MICO|nr:hypothetical protein [Agromyces larvae]UOE42866.1 hypothetical protein MTO99_11775 [Agromyces larvae]